MKALVITVAVIVGLGVIALICDLIQGRGKEELDPWQSYLGLYAFVLCLPLMALVSLKKIFFER